MSRTLGTATLLAMQIRLEVEHPDPPCGTAASEGGAAVPFQGWLGLLGVLSSLLEVDTGSAGPRSGTVEERGSAR